MKFVKYTLIDQATKKPLSEEPARSGTEHPHGFESLYFDRDSFSTGIPFFYGICKETENIPEWVDEVSEEQFVNGYKNFILADANDKYENKIASPIEYNDIMFPVGCDDINKYIQLLNLLDISDIQQIDHKIGDSWVVLKPSVLRGLLQLHTKALSESRTWIKSIEAEVMAESNIYALRDIRKTIFES